MKLNIGLVDYRVSNRRIIVAVCVFQRWSVTEVADRSTDVDCSFVAGNPEEVISRNILFLAFHYARITYLRVASPRKGGNRSMDLSSHRGLGLRRKLSVFSLLPL